ncbi:hypothetical protein D3C71_1437950 [compost metagenome]
MQDAINAFHASSHRLGITDIQVAHFFARPCRLLRRDVGQAQEIILAAEMLPQYQTDCSGRAGDQNAPHRAFLVFVVLHAGPVI